MTDYRIVYRWAGMGTQVAYVDAPSEDDAERKFWRSYPQAIIVRVEAL